MALDLRFLTCLTLAATPAAASPCALASKAEAATVARALDGDTMLLGDGRELRLAGVAAPKAPLGTRADDWPAAEAARRALAEETGARPLELRLVSGSPDRHGRLVGHLAVAGEPDHAGVAARLLARGQLRVSADAFGRDCRATLAQAERPAVGARLGLWSDPYYEVRNAHDGAALASLSGRFVVAEGRVASVRISAGRAYINFGRRWREALSLSFSEAALRKLGGFEALGVRSGIWVRARGVVELRRGPVIYVTDVAQVEAVDGRKR